MALFLKRSNIVRMEALNQLMVSESEDENIICPVTVGVNSRASLSKPQGASIAQNENPTNKGANKHIGSAKTTSVGSVFGIEIDYHFITFLAMFWRFFQRQWDRPRSTILWVPFTTPIKETSTRICDHFTIARREIWNQLQVRNCSPEVLVNVLVT